MSDASIWSPVQGIAGIGGLLFAALHWAGITPSTIFRSKREIGAPMKTEKKSVWVGVLITFSLALFAGSSYVSNHISHPYWTWVIVGGLGLVAIILWAILLKSTAADHPPKTVESIQAEFRANLQEKIKRIEDDAKLSRAEENLKHCEEARRQLQAQIDALPLPQERKLVIHDATYGAIDGEGTDYPVEPFLNQIAGPNGLAFEIQNRLFKVNGWDYVPEDPKDYHVKRLKLTYSFGGGPKQTIRRRETTWLVLPEDPSIEGFPMLRLDVIRVWNRLRAFFNGQVERIKREYPNANAAVINSALMYDGTPDLYLSAAYQRLLKTEMIELNQSLVNHRIKDPHFEQLIHNADCRKDIEKMMEFLWQIAPRIKEEDDEKDRVPGRQGSPRKI